MSVLDLDMGRYAAFVWPAYAVTAAVLVWMLVDSLARARRFRREVERLQRHEGDAP
jgi:heme exporter protein D